MHYKPYVFFTRRTSARNNCRGGSLPKISFTTLGQIRVNFSCVFSVVVSRTDEAAQFVATLSFFHLSIKHQIFLLLCDVFAVCVVAQCANAPYRTVRRRELFVRFSVKFHCLFGFVKEGDLWSNTRHSCF